MRRGRRVAAAAGGVEGGELDQSGILVGRTAPTAVLEHSLGAVVCKGSSTCWHDYELSEHGGRRGQPLGASAAGVGGAGGVGGGVCDRIGASAPVHSMVDLARSSALLAAPVRRCAPQWCAMMARDGSRLAARHVAS